MNKLFTKIAGAALGLTMAIGVGVAVASNVKEAAPVHAAGTTTFTTTTSGGFSNNTKTDGGVTVTFGGSPSWQSGHVRVYAGATVSFTSSSENITSIVVSHTETSKYPINWSSNPSGISSATWTGSSSSVTLTNSSSKQVRITSIDVTTVASKTLSGIGVSTAPTKTTYLVGETFDPTGLVISRTWSSGNPDTYAYAGHTTEFTFSPTTSTALTTSNTSVTITYGGKSTSQAITVNAPKTPASVASSGETTTFETGDTFAYGGTLTATYTDSTNASVSPESFKIGAAGINPTSAGTVITPGSTILNRDDHNGKTVYVLYTENNVTVYTSYVITVKAVSSIVLTAGTDVGTSSSNNSPDTLTKSGITMYGSDAAFATAEYRYYSGSTLTFTSTAGKMTKIEFTGDSSKKMGNISLSSGGGNVVIDGNDATWTAASGGTNEVSFSFSAQNRATLVKITLASNDPLVELDASSATSVTMMKGDQDTSVKIHVVNITTKSWTYTFDEDEDEGLATSSYINVSAGAAVDDVHTLTITTKAVGSTRLHISVSGTACATSIPVTVNAKPASMTIVHSEIKDGHLEIKTGASKQVSFSGLDTDGNPYSIVAADVTGSVESGSSYVSISGTSITANVEGTAVVRYTLNALTTVYAEVTIDAKDDYLESVVTVTFATGLSATQGDSPTLAVFTAHTGQTHFKLTQDIPLDYFRFSYTNAMGEPANQFGYDFEHGEVEDATHKSQTIYVYCTLGNVSVGSYTISVEQKDDPLTAITITNVDNNAKEMARGTSFQLEIAYTPTNPTDGKEVVYRVDDYDTGVDVSVSNAGLIAVSSTSGLGTALIVVESAHDDTIYDFVTVTVTLESMTYIVDEDESLTPSSTVAVGDRVIMVATDKNSVDYEMTGFSGTSTNYGVATSYTTVSKTLVLTVVSGNSTGTVAFKTSDDEYVAWVSGKNSITNKSTLDDYGSWIIDGSTFQNKQDTTRYMYLNYNSGTPRFACYADKSADTTGNYTVPTFLKFTGGETEYNVSADLFNGVHNNFGSGKTYKWSESCPEFDFESWSEAGYNLSSISNFSSYKLDRAVGNLSGNEIEVFIAKYDAVVAKFWKDCTAEEREELDFLGRVESGKVTPASSRITILGNVEATNIVPIIVVVSIMSAAAVGGYFMLRKRKEQ